MKTLIKIPFGTYLTGDKIVHWLTENVGSYNNGWCWSEIVRADYDIIFDFEIDALAFKLKFNI